MQYDGMNQCKLLQHRDKAAKPQSLILYGAN